MCVMVGHEDGGGMEVDSRLWLVCFVVSLYSSSSSTCFLFSRAPATSCCLLFPLAMPCINSGMVPSERRGKSVSSLSYFSRHTTEPAVFMAGGWDSMQKTAWARHQKSPPHERSHSRASPARAPSSLRYLDWNSCTKVARGVLMTCTFSVGRR